MKREYPFSRASLCVVGNVNRDVKSSPLAPRENLFSDGETSVDSITETIGGGGANSACALIGTMSSAYTSGHTTGPPAEKA